MRPLLFLIIAVNCVPRFTSDGLLRLKAGPFMTLVTDYLGSLFSDSQVRRYHSDSYDISTESGSDFKITICKRGLDYCDRFILGSWDFGSDFLYEVIDNHGLMIWFEEWLEQHMLGYQILRNDGSVIEDEDDSPLYEDDGEDNSLMGDEIYDDGEVPFMQKMILGELYDRPTRIGEAWKDDR